MCTCVHQLDHQSVPTRGAGTTSESRRLVRLDDGRPVTLDPKPEALNPLIQVRLDGGRPVTAAAAIGGEGYAGMFQKQVKVNEEPH